MGGLRKVLRDMVLDKFGVDVGGRNNGPRRTKPPGHVDPITPPGHIDPPGVFGGGPPAPIKYGAPQVNMPLVGAPPAPITPIAKPRRRR
jgi:hypothetical protein